MLTLPQSPNSFTAIISPLLHFFSVLHYAVMMFPGSSSQHIKSFHIWYTDATSMIWTLCGSVCSETLRLPELLMSRNGGKCGKFLFHFLRDQSVQRQWLGPFIARMGKKTTAALLTCWSHSESTFRNGDWQLWYASKSIGNVSGNNRHQLTHQYIYTHPVKEKS